MCNLGQGGEAKLLVNTFTIFLFGNSGRVFKAAQNVLGNATYMFRHHTYIHFYSLVPIANWIIFTRGLEKMRC